MVAGHLREKNGVLSHGTELCGRIRKTTHAVQVYRSDGKGKQKARRKDAFRGSCRQGSGAGSKSNRTQYVQSSRWHDSFYCIPARLAGNDEKRMWRKPPTGRMQWVSKAKSSHTLRNSTQVLHCRMSHPSTYRTTTPTN